MPLVSSARHRSSFALEVSFLTFIILLKPHFLPNVKSLKKSVYRREECFWMLLICDDGRIWFSLFSICGRYYLPQTKKIWSEDVIHFQRLYSCNLILSLGNPKKVWVQSNFQAKFVLLVMNGIRIFAIEKTPSSISVWIWLPYDILLKSLKLMISSIIAEKITKTELLDFSSG